MFGSQTNIENIIINRSLSDFWLNWIRLHKLFIIMIYNNHEAALILTKVKRYLHGISMKEPDAIVILHLDMIDEVIRFIEPDADINHLCDEVRLKRT